MCYSDAFSLLSAASLEYREHLLSSRALILKQSSLSSHLRTLDILGVDFHAVTERRLDIIVLVPDGP